MSNADITDLPGVFRTKWFLENGSHGDTGEL